MKDREFKKVLKEEENYRKELLNNAFESMNDYSKKIMKDEKTIEKNKIDEVKYKTTINELNDYIEIYKKKIDELEKENKEISEENMKIKKKELKYETNNTSLVSVLETLINEYGINEISSITNLAEGQINKLINKD